MGASWVFKKIEPYFECIYVEHVDGGVDFPGRDLILPQDELSNEIDRVGLIHPVELVVFPRLGVLLHQIQNAPIVGNEISHEGAAKRGDALVDRVTRPRFALRVAFELGLEFALWQIPALDLKH